MQKKSFNYLDNREKKIQNHSKSRSGVWGRAEARMQCSRPRWNRRVSPKNKQTRQMKSPEQSVETLWSSQD